MRVVLAGADAQRGCGLGRVGEPDRDLQGGGRGGLGQIAQQPAGADRGQLPVITDQPHTRPRRRHMLDQAGEVGSGGHPGLVDQHQRPGRQRRLRRC